MALAKAAEAGGIEGGHKVRMRSLYTDGFNPLFSSDERSAYFDFDKGPARMPKDIQDGLDDLKWCDTIVFVYPTWWLDMPAMLKGFFDRVLVPGKDGAWHFPTKEEKGRMLSGGLEPDLLNIKRIVGVSTYGAPWWMLIPTDMGRGVISMGIRHGCFGSFDCTCRWMALYDLDFTPVEKRTAFLEQVKKALKDEV